MAQLQRSHQSPVRRQSGIGVSSSAGIDVSCSFVGCKMVGRFTREWQAALRVSHSIIVSVQAARARARARAGGVRPFQSGTSLLAVTLRLRRTPKFGPEMKQSRSSRATKAEKAVQRAIAKSKPTKEPPTVGKPVIVDPAEPRRSVPARSKRSRKPSRTDEAP